jgi:hypothetical protein
VHGLADAQGRGALAIAGDVVRLSADDDQPGLVHLVECVPESLEQQIDALVVLQVPHVHRDRHACRLGRQVPVAVVARGWREQGRVLDPSHRRGGSVSLGDVLQRHAHGKDAGAPPHGDRLEAAQDRGDRLEPGKRVEHLLGERRIHVVDVRDAGERLHGRSDERRLLHRVHQVVPRTAHHPRAGAEHGDVADDLLERESRPDVAHAGHSGDPIDATVRNLDVAPLVIGERIDDVSPRAEKLQHRFHGDRGSARLEEGLWRQEQYSHTSTSGRRKASGTVSGAAHPS